MADITKINLNGTALTIVDSAATSAIAGEIARAQGAESAITSALSAEVVARESADTALQTAIGTKADSASTYTKTEVDEKLASAATATTQEIAQAVSGKADASSVYTKTEVDNKFTSAATATTQEIAQAVSGKQDTLTAGTGIQISGNVISCTIDTGLYVVVQTLPAQPAAGNENKIHLVPLPASATGQNDQYEEYLWKGTEWEYLGVRQADIDLSDYYTSGQTDTLLAGKVDNSTYSAYTASTNSAITSAQTTADSAVTAISSHTANTNNPHQVTAAQLGISASYCAATETLILNIPGGSPSPTPEPTPSDNFYIVDSSDNTISATSTDNGVWQFSFDLGQPDTWSLYNNGTIVTASSINITLLVDGVDIEDGLSGTNYAVENIDTGTGTEDDDMTLGVLVSVTASTLAVEGTVEATSPQDPCAEYGSQEECDCVTGGGSWDGENCTYPEEP